MFSENTAYKDKEMDSYAKFIFSTRVDEFLTADCHRGRDVFSADPPPKQTAKKNRGTTQQHENRR